MHFSTFNLPTHLLTALPAQCQQATPVQQLSLPAALSGQDVLALAPTGSGKTLAFGLPVLAQLAPSLNVIQGVIIAPTRELAAQIAQVLAPLGQALALRLQTLCGGEALADQIAALANTPQLVIATPGRLADLLAQQQLDLSAVTHLVLDEADRLLDMGFWPQVQQLIAQLPANKQTLLFSATLPAALSPLALAILKSPIRIGLDATQTIAPAIEERVYLVNKGSKAQALIALLALHCDIQVLVFISAKDSVDAVTKKLLKANINAAALHGDKDQQARSETLAAFKRGDIRVLVATDLLARGIDVESLPLVINADLPSHAPTYVHRIGRTARAGASGLAISLTCHGEAEQLVAIRTLTGRELATDALAGFPVTDQPSIGVPKRAPRDKQANRRSLNKRSIKDFAGKVPR